MWGENYRWHFDYVRLAWDTSFNFEKHKPGFLDKSQICLLDIERIVQDRDFAAVERNIPVVTQYVLEPEQAQVLDPNFVKIFRIAQLAVQYLLFCKKYLDNTVVLLKKELSNLKEENSELKSFNDDLKDHVSELLKKIKDQSKTYYKCDRCSKVFSKEEFLSAHKKKRHDPDNSNDNNETDKLQSEIKLLKERLNQTEQRLIIKHEQTENKTVINNERDDIKYQELQQKFEIWKVQVENELKLVQTQRNMEDKYEKWLENAFDKLKESFSSSTKFLSEKDVDTTATDFIKHEMTTQTDKVQLQIETKPVLEIPPQIEMNNEQKHDEVLPIIQEEMAKLEENIDSKVSSGLLKMENHMATFWDKLNALQEVNNQNKTKDVQVENNNSENSDEIYEPPPPIILKPHRTKIDDKQEKRKYRKPYTLPPTTKETAPLTLLKKKSPIKQRNDSKSKTSTKKSSEIKFIKRATSFKTEESSSEDESTDVEIKSHNLEVEVIDKRSTKVIESKPSRISTLGKRSITRLRQDELSYEMKILSLKVGTVVDMRRVLSRALQLEKEGVTLTLPSHPFTFDEDNAAVKDKLQEIVGLFDVLNTPAEVLSLNEAVDQNVLKKFREEINNILNSRLQELGISPDWTSVPSRTFQRALEIVNHQATLTEKKYSSFKKIREKLLKEINNNVAKRRKSFITAPKQKSVKNIPKKPVVINLTKKRSPQQSTVVEIKNRKMYETESEESDSQLAQAPKKVIFKNNGATSTNFSEVIKELKSRAVPNKDYDNSDFSPTEEQHDKIIKSDTEDSIFEIQKGEINKKTVNNTQTKGVLKSYPSIGSLAKKKVLFDLGSDTYSTKQDEEKPIKDGGSTTSLGSSVLDGTPRRESPSHVIKVQKSQLKNDVVEDLSDFDF